MANSSQPTDHRVAQVFLETMARHGVAVVKNASGRVGTLALRGDQVVQFGLQVLWARSEDRARFWQAARLPGMPVRVLGDERLFFQELMRAVYPLGVERMVWNDDTKVMFVRDEAAPSGLSFKMRDLNCVACGAEPLGIHL